MSDPAKTSQPATLMDMFNQSGKSNENTLSGILQKQTEKNVQIKIVSGLNNLKTNPTHQQSASKTLQLANQGVCNKLMPKILKLPVSVKLKTFQYPQNLPSGGVNKAMKVPSKQYQMQDTKNANKTLVNDTKVQVLPVLGREINSTGKTEIDKIIEEAVSDSVEEEEVSMDDRDTVEEYDVVLDEKSGALIQEPKHILDEHVEFNDGSAELAKEQNDSMIETDKIATEVDFEDDIDKEAAKMQKVKATDKADDIQANVDQSMIDQVQENFVLYPVQTVVVQQEEGMMIIMTKIYRDLFRTHGKVLFKRNDCVYLLQHITSHKNIVDQLKKELIENNAGNKLDLFNEEILAEEEWKKLGTRVANDNILQFFISAQYTALFKVHGKVMIQRNDKIYFIQHITSHYDVIKSIKQEIFGGPQSSSIPDLDAEERFAKSLAQTPKKIAQFDTPITTASVKSKPHPIPKNNYHRSKPTIEDIRKMLIKPTNLERVDEFVNLMKEINEYEKRGRTSLIPSEKWDDLIAICVERYSNLNGYVKHKKYFYQNRDVTMEFKKTELTPLPKLVAEKKKQLNKGEEIKIGEGLLQLNDDEKELLDKLYAQSNLIAGKSQAVVGPEEDCDEEIVLTKTKSGKPIMRLRSNKAFVGEKLKALQLKRLHNKQYAKNLQMDRRKAIALQKEVCRIYLELGADVPERVTQKVRMTKMPADAILDPNTGKWNKRPVEIISRAQVKQRILMLEQEKNKLLELIGSIENYQPLAVSEALVLRTLGLMPQARKHALLLKRQRRKLDPEEIRLKNKEYKSKWHKSVINPQKLRDAQAIQNKVLDLMHQLGIEPPDDLRETIKIPSLNAQDYIHILDPAERKRTRHALENRIRYHFYRSLPGKLEQLTTVLERLEKLANVNETRTGNRYFHIPIPEAKKPKDKRIKKEQGVQQRGSQHIVAKKNVVVQNQQWGAMANQSAVKQPYKTQKIEKKGKVQLKRRYSSGSDGEANVAAYHLQRSMKQVKREPQLTFNLKFPAEVYDMPELQ